LAVITKLADVERMLDGWQKAVGLDESLTWLRERLATLR
jgi:hypothetical protein